MDCVVRLWNLPKYRKSHISTSTSEKEIMVNEIREMIVKQYSEMEPSWSDGFFWRTLWTVAVFCFYSIVQILLLYLLIITGYGVKKQLSVLELWLNLWKPPKSLPVLQCHPLCQIISKSSCSFSSSMSLLHIPLCHRLASSVLMVYSFALPVK